MVLSSNFCTVRCVRGYWKTGRRCTVYTLDQINVQSSGAEECAASGGEKNGMTTSVG
jgi:hypothetical protein